jgi:hypothetical protein
VIDDLLSTLKLFSLYLEFKLSFGVYRPPNAILELRSSNGIEFILASLVE